MGRLKTLPPRLSSAPSRLKAQTDRQGHSRLERWRGWYSLARWRHPKHGLRIRVLIRDLFTCQMQGCGKIEPDTSLLVADHKIPHRGDERLFWDEDNVWTLCKDCHDRVKQAEERRGLWG